MIDAAAVDGRRRLVLVRRDNIEHLLMIGGPTDIVVEPNIVRATRRAGSDCRNAARAGRTAHRGLRRCPSRRGPDGETATVRCFRPSCGAANAGAAAARGAARPLPMRCAGPRRARNGAAIPWPASRRNRCGNPLAGRPEPRARIARRTDAFACDLREPRCPLARDRAEAPKAPRGARTGTRRAAPAARPCSGCSGPKSRRNGATAGSRAPAAGRRRQRTAGWRATGRAGASCQSRRSAQRAISGRADCPAAGQERL